jgi:hypothetical protein
MKKALFFISILCLSASCVSTKSSIKNIDDNAPTPRLINNTTFLLSEYSKDKKYGYDKDYPINVFFMSTRNDTINQERFLNALAGPNGEMISYAKVESCCPFPTKRSEMGAGFLDVYEIRWTGQKNAIKLYMNCYEKGALLVPVGLRIKK